jgi:hypothetical protein
VSRIRKLIYRLGFRPTYPSIFYSPSAALNYIMRDAVRDHLMKIHLEEENKNG